MPKTTRTMVILFALNLIIFGLSFYLFADIKKIDKIVSSRLAQIESEIKKDDFLRSIKNLMSETKKEREQMEHLFVQPNGTVDFIETVESFGGIADVKIEIESVGVTSLKSKTASSTIESFNLSFKTEGSWENTMHLLSLLENMPYKISFENVKLGRISAKSSSSSESGKGKNLPYWGGNFSFSALKIKNLPEKSVVSN